MGLLFADGHNGEHNLVTISLKEQGNTETVLQTFLNDIQAVNLKIDKVSASGFYQQTSSSILLKIGFSNQHINHTLSDWGMEKSKDHSRTHIPSDIIKNDLTRHFIRGLFDGDGYYSKKIVIKTSGNGYRDRKYFELMGNVSLLSEIESVFRTELNLKPHKVLSNYNSSKIFLLKYSSLAEVDKICHYLYDDATIYLSHKSPFR